MTTKEQNKNNNDDDAHDYEQFVAFRTFVSGSSRNLASKQINKQNQKEREGYAGDRKVRSISTFQ